jgi:hypothetical protein
MSDYNDDVKRTRGLAMYARLTDPQPATGAYKDIIPPNWKTDLLVTEAEATRLRGEGMKVQSGSEHYNKFIEENMLKEKGYAGDYIQAYKSSVRKVWNPELGRTKKDENGDAILEPAQRPKVYDAARNEITYDTFRNGFAIGNGSEVTVAYVPTAKIGQTTNKNFRLIEVVIHELVKYVPKQKGTADGSFVFDPDSPF